MSTCGWSTPSSTCGRGQYWGSWEYTEGLVYGEGVVLGGKLREGMMLEEVLVY